LHIGLVFSVGIKKQPMLTDSNVNLNNFNADLFNLRYGSHVVGIIYSNFSEEMVFASLK